MLFIIIIYILVINFMNTFYIQGPAHSSASLSQPTHTGARLCTEATIVGHFFAGSSYHDNWFRQTWFPLRSTHSLELTF